MTGLASGTDDHSAEPVATSTTEATAETIRLTSSPLPASDSVAGLAATIQALDSTAESLPPVETDDDDDDEDDTPRVSRADDSYYWDPSTMAPLNARSAAAIARLRAFRPPPFPQWDRLPLSRRAAVLVLLYADRRGDLRVVLTMRAASLRNYSGHAAFPGGKADTLDETPEQIARREAWEEIGLPLDADGGDADAPAPSSLSSSSSSSALLKTRLPRGFRIEHLCALPHNLAKTELVVRPCVALLHAPGGDGSVDGSSGSNGQAIETPDETLIPRLDAKEVAAVFSAPFHNFLLATDEVTADGTATPLALTGSSSDSARLPPKLPPGPWYEGEWMHWHEKPWRLHFFYVPVVGQRVAKPRAPALLAERRGSDGSRSAENAQYYNGNRQAAIVAAVDQPEPIAAGAAVPEKEDEQKDEDASPPQVQQEAPGRYKVWGMTARILVDAAKLAYGEEPEFEHNAHLGDEQVIEGLVKMGRLGEKKRPGSELTHEDVKEASKM